MSLIQSKGLMFVFAMLFDGLLPLPRNPEIRSNRAYTPVFRLDLRNSTIRSDDFISAGL